MFVQLVVEKIRHFTAEFLRSCGEKGSQDTLPPRDASKQVLTLQLVIMASLQLLPQHPVNRLHSDPDA